MLTVHGASAVIGGTFTRAQPQVALDGGPGGDLVIAHLTHGFNKSDSEKSGVALRIDGQVGITVDARGPGAEVEIAFLQFVRFNFVGIFFAERKRTEGSIGILVHPALTKTVLLEPNRKMPPWMSETPFTRAGNLAKNAMGDHPFLQTVRQAPNFTTGVPNFLCNLIDDRDFWSVFSARAGETAKPASERQCPVVPQRAERLFPLTRAGAADEKRANTQTTSTGHPWGTFDAEE
jgi:hypothetical protein